MTLVPLRDGEMSDAERLMLDSALGDEPGVGARAKTLAALGVTSGIAATGAGVAHAASGTALGGASGKVAGSATTLALSKWLAIGAAAGFATTGGLVVATNPDLVTGRSPSSARAAQTQSARSESRVVNRRAPDERRAAGVSPFEPAEGSAPPAARPRAFPGEEEPSGGALAAPQGTAFPVPAADTVAAEVAALDQARSALAADDARGALVRLDRYDSLYPRGALSPEATVLRVRALARLGRHGDASAVADAFVRAHPGSAQAARLRALVGESAR